jgi:tRNA A37 threonylcarbamoyladenosine dehydratase
MGVATLVIILFRHWQLLASRLGAAGFICAGVGAVGVWAIKRVARSRLQSRHGG